MRIIDARSKAGGLGVHARRLDPVRLRRPTPLPIVVPTTSFGRYLQRLRWLFGGAL